MVARVVWDHLIRVRISALRQLKALAGGGPFNPSSNLGIPTNLNWESLPAGRQGFPALRQGNIYKNKKMYYVYAIESQKNFDLYKGFTNNVNKRIKEHNVGLTESTKNYRPWKLVYCEVFINKYDAIKREKYLKESWGRKFLREVIKNYLKDRKK
jgi:putative endonuclease